LLAHPAAASKFESEAARRAISLAESAAASPSSLLTVCEQSGYRKTAPQSEVLELAARFRRRSSAFTSIEIGRTAEGRPLHMWTLAAGSPAGKPVILLQCAVHGGETAGKDATLMLLRDAVLGRYPLWLQRCVILAIPIFNVDGHERRSRWNRGNQNGPRDVGSRVTAQGLDLNRDYMKADAPEMRAWLRAYQSHLPHLLIDNHTSNGIDFQYDVTFHIQTRRMVARPVAGFQANFRRALVARLEADGHITGPYFELEEPPDPGAALRLEFRPPGYSWGYASAQNRGALVVESHSLKSYRTQVWAHYDLMRHAIDLVCQDPRALTRAVRAADREIASLAALPRPSRLFLDGDLSGPPAPYLFRGLAFRRKPSGIPGVDAIEYSSEPRAVPVSVLERVRPTSVPTVPVAYVIPPEWSAAADLLALHGVRTRTLKRPLAGDFEVYRLENEQWDARPTAGRHRLHVRSRRIRLRAAAPAGWILVPMRQRAAGVAFHLLEPSGPESLIRWGFFNTILDQTEYLSSHVFLPLARQMLRTEPRVRAAFDAAFASGPDARTDAESRLDFLYARSPFAEKRRNLYPIWRIPVRNYGVDSSRANRKTEV
jgi:hypothetical protein